MAAAGTPINQMGGLEGSMKEYKKSPDRVKTRNPIVVVVVVVVLEM